ncbi:hypothetical protein ACKWRH_32105 [Bradyrhizobium sp. Pa8]|uniref:hypothetical protein n=1 Tax=Bradyrhizobium sp. Pa8 TaxID=3386552 RepID=UPI00403F711F
MARWKQDWTAEEIEKLRTLAGTMPLTQIAAALFSALVMMPSNRSAGVSQIIPAARDAREVLPVVGVEKQARPPVHAGGPNFDNDVILDRL